jgi:hypothetical protein
MLVEGFREEVVRVGRALRRRVEAERPGAPITTTLYPVRSLLAPHGCARSERVRGIGLAHLAVGEGMNAEVIPICVGWEDGRVSAVLGGERWYPGGGPRTCAVVCPAGAPGTRR